MRQLLWVDDIRNPFKDDWLNFSPIGRNCKVYWAQSYKEAINYLEKPTSFICGITLYRKFSIFFCIEFFNQFKTFLIGQIWILHSVQNIF